MRFLGDYSNDEEQYKALMNDGATFAKAHKLRPGVALTAEQVAQLTSDIVWMVEQEITLPNGSKTKALVPQVYVKVKPGDIDGSGALLAGRNVDIKTGGNLDNSGTIAGRKIVALNANNVNNLGRITGQQVGLTAKEDINVIGGTVDASQKLIAVAGRDVNVTTTTSTGKNAAGNVSSTIVDRVAGLYVTGGTGGTLYVSADRDVNLKAATVSNASLATGGLTNADKSANTEGLTAIVAKRDINLGTVTTASTQNLRRDDVTYRNESLSQDIGSSITGAGNIALQAGNDIYAKAATVQAGGVLSATAAGNLVISAGQDKTSVAGGSQSVSRGFFSKTTTTSTYDNQSSTLVGSSFVGAKGTNLEASYGTLAIEAATIGCKDSKTTLTGADVDIRSGVNQSTSQTTSSSSSSGLGKIFGSGNGEGSSESSQTSLALTTIEGKGVSIQATGNAGIGGKLPGDINLTAVKINPNEAEGGKLDLSAKGDLNLASITTTDYAKSESKGSSLLWQSAEGKGHVNDSVHYNQIQVDPKNINLNIGNKITADMSVKDSVAVLASQPQLAYMAKMINDPALSNKVNWSKVQEAHDQWDYKQSGLTPAASAIVALAVAVATSGAGANAVGLMTGTSSSTALASYGVSTAAMQAAITTLASKATVSMINNQGDLGAVFNELGSSDSIKQLATAIITAGAVSALGSAIQIQGADGAMMSLDQVTAKTGGGGLVANIGKNLINGVARATITSAITNTSLEQSLQTEIVASVLNAASAAGANAVGDAATSGIDAAGNSISPSLNEFGRALAHAVVGCMAGAAGAAANGSGLSSGNGCNAGAIGAVVGELSATYFNSDLAVGETQKVNTVEFASLMAGIAGALTGQGADAIAVAASTGGNAAANNYLNHTQWKQLADRLAACKTEAECGAVRKEYLATSIKQDQQLAAACTDLNSATCKTHVAAALEGTKEQERLAAEGKLPASYLAASDLNKTANAIAKKWITNSFNATCAADPSCMAKGQAAKEKMVSTMLDFVPLVGDVKGFIEAKSPFDYMIASVGLIPGVGDAVGKLVKEAKILAELGETAKATEKLIEAKAVASEVKFGVATVAQIQVAKNVTSNNEKTAALLNNFYRDGAPPELIEQTFIKAAERSTHNAGASEVILGKYIANSTDSYEAVAQARGSTYFSMSDWSTVAGQLGADKMWNINKAFLEQQMQQGKSFAFTANPAADTAGAFTKLEFQHLMQNGYRLIKDGSLYRAVKN